MGFTIIGFRHIYVAIPGVKMDNAEQHPTQMDMHAQLKKQRFLSHLCKRHKQRIIQTDNVIYSRQITPQFLLKLRGQIKDNGSPKKQENLQNTLERSHIMIDKLPMKEESTQA